MIVLNHRKIGKHSKKISKVKRISIEYNWEEINYPSGKGDQEKN